MKNNIFSPFWHRPLSEARKSGDTLRQDYWVAQGRANVEHTAAASSTTIPKCSTKGEQVQAATLPDLELESLTGIPAGDPLQQQQPERGLIDRMKE